MDWERIRNDFPVTKELAYFESAAMSPIPTPVFEAIMTEYRKLMEWGDANWCRDLERLNAVKGACADLLNSGGEDIAFVANTSTAMSLAGLSLQKKMEPDQHFLTMKDEFPSSTFPFSYLGIPLRICKPDSARYSVSSILEQINSKTAGVITSYVQFGTGFRQDLLSLGEELKRRNLLFIVNATQGFPYFPVDVREMNIDVLTASLHKWGMTGHLGSLFYTAPEFRSKYPTAVAGWLSINPGEGLVPGQMNSSPEIYSSADQYTLGTINLQILMAFKRALDYIEKISLDVIRKRLFTLTDYLLDGLSDCPVEVISPHRSYAERSAIVSFKVGKTSAECVTFLRKNKIFVSLRNEAIRAAVNIFNNFNDLDRLLGGVQNFCSKNP
ncbi:MAG: aminotransferase class V-fold PLP-dependent enzyme [Candidatus Aminicenantes bacterium]|nr:aminotransferase class V-fold PLP-dependent enzyme [Candidatus Aminicenantes bacterium]